MITLRPAKSIQGAVTLPASPDLIFMTALGSCAAARNVKIPCAANTEVVKDIARSLSGHAAVHIDDDSITVSPLTADDDPALLLALPESLLPYRSIYLFMGLGMGKTVIIRSAPEKLLNEYIAAAKRVGVTIEKVDIDQTTGLRTAYFDSGIAKDSSPTEDDCAALTAFLFGKGEALEFTITDYHLSSPLRQLAHAFGHTFNAKQNSDGGDPLAKRMRFLKSKQRDTAAQSLAYTVTVDFSKRDDKNDTLTVTVPGDETLAAALVTLKCLVPKGSLEISNVPLESWGSQAISFIKKMGGKINVKADAKTTLGVCGTVSILRSDCAGRKQKCSPIYQFVSQLPCMTVAAAFAEGKSVFRELSQLRLYEPDGLDQLEQSLRPLGVRHGEMPDGIVVEGAKEFDGFDIIEPLPAHIAIAFCAAGLKCVGKTSIADEHIFARWPTFENMLHEICAFR